MNLSFRLVWNAAQGLWVVASELAKGKSQTKNHACVNTLKPFLVKTLLSVSIGVMALPVYSSEWIGGVSSAWDVAENWDGGVPDSSGLAEIDNGLAMISTAIEVDTIEITSQQYSSGTLYVSGNSAELIAFEIIVEEGIFEVSGGANFEAEYLLLDGFREKGVMNLSGTDTTASINEIIVGYWSEGALQITDGALLTADEIYIGYEEGSKGSVSVSGNGSSIKTKELYLIGGSTSGASSLEIKDGATVEIDAFDEEDDDGDLGWLGISGNGSTGLVTVADTGSLLRATTIYIDASEGGKSSLKVSDGALVEVRYLALEGDADSVTKVSVSGKGSALSADGIYVTSGTLEVSNGAEVKVVNELTIAVDSDSIGAVIVGAAEGESAVASGALLADDIRFGGGAGFLIFNHTDTNYELTADLVDTYGNGHVSLFSGTMSFTGDLTDYSGIMTVDGGTLRIASGKTLELGGSYTQTSSGVLKVGASSNSNYGKLAVAGTATFAANSAIAVDVASANSLAVDGTLSSVVSAGTLNASTFSVTDNSALFNFSAVLNNNTIDLTVERGLLVSDYIKQQGHTSSAGAAAVLDTLMSGGTTGTDMDNIVTAMGKLSTAEEVSDAVAQTLPLLQGANNQVASSVIQTTGRVIQTRQSVTSGASSGDGFITDKKGWVKVIGSRAEQDELNGVSGFVSKSYGVIGGIDGDVDSKSSLGIALSFVDSSIKSASSSTNNGADIEAYQLVFYGQYALGTDYKNINLSWQADVGLNQTEGFRDIAFMSRMASASFNSYISHLGAGAGRTFTLSPNTVIVPSVRADFYYIKNESYNESGAGALNLQVESSTAQDFILTLQGDLEHGINENFIVSANLGVGYDVMNDATSLTSSYEGGGTAFTTEGLEQSPWVVSTGVNVNYSLNDTTQITASYDVQGRENFLSQTASAKVKWLF
jgi:T5SS/PEP-CTERM-associated repeat protein